jgi:hypothetical protein
MPLENLCLFLGPAKGVLTKESKKIARSICPNGKHDVAL